MKILFANIICIVSLISFFSCTKSDNNGTTGLTIQTAAVTSVKQLSAVSGGTISADGGSAILQRGICWNTAANPTIANNKTAAGAGTGSFTGAISGLTPNTAYYVRAYAINSKDTAYGAQVSFTTQAISIAGSGVTDVEGNTYTTVIIGGKEWMVENLRVTKYRNGDAIPNVTDQAAWKNQTAGAWCYYNNTPGYNNTYGKLYNLYAVGDARQIAPAGWHVPSSGEYTVLTAYFGGNSLAGGALKETGAGIWAAPNTGATNSSGFTALPGGQRVDFGPGFYDFGTDGYWATSDPGGSPFRLRHNTTSVQTNLYATKVYGFAVRCIKD